MDIYPPEFMTQSINVIAKVPQSYISQVLPIRSGTQNGAVK